MYVYICVFIRNMRGVCINTRAQYKVHGIISCRRKNALMIYRSVVIGARVQPNLYTETHDSYYVY